MSKFKTALLGTAAIAVAAGFAAAPAAAQDAKVVASGSEKVKLTLSGQINRHAQLIDDGIDTTILHTDNGLTGSRFRIGGSAKVNADVSVGTMIEMGIIPNNQGTGNTQHNANQNSGGASTHEARVVDIWFNHAQFGRLYMGKGAMGSDATQEQTNNMMGAIMQTGDITHMAAGVTFNHKRGNLGGDGTSPPTINNLRVNQVFADIDGLSRMNRVRYDTPTFMGFQGRVSHADQGIWDASLFHRGTYEGFSVLAAYGYAQNHTGAIKGQHSGSVSVMSPWGISLGASAGHREFYTATNQTRDAHTFWGATVTYEKQFSELGKTGIGYTFTTHDGSLAATATGAPKQNFNGQGHQVAVVQDIAGAGTEVYASWGMFSINTDDTIRGAGNSEFENVHSWTVGSRVRF